MPPCPSDLRSSAASQALLFRSGAEEFDDDTLDREGFSRPVLLDGAETGAARTAEDLMAMLAQEAGVAFSLLDDDGPSLSPHELLSAFEAAEPDLACRFDPVAHGMLPEVTNAVAT